MDKIKKRILYSFIIIIFSAILLSGLKLMVDRSYRSGIPGLPDMQSLHPSLRDQITEADKKARHNPTSQNLGKLGMVYHSSAYYDKAKQCYIPACLRSKDSWIWSYYLGYLNLELGESAASIENFRNVIRINKNADLALYYKGEAFKNLGMSDSAEAVFKKISEPAESSYNKGNPSINTLFPLNVYAKFHLARLYMDKSKPDDAEQVLKEIIAGYMMFGPAYRLLGNLYLSKGEDTTGNKYLARANDLADYLPPVDTIIDKIAFISRSEIYLTKQIDLALRRLNPQWALDLLDNTKNYFPDNKFLISKAIKLYLWTGYGSRALPFLEKHLRAFGDDFDELMEIAELLYDNKFQSEAFAYFREAGKLKAGDPAVQARLALWLADRGNGQEAVRIINQQMEKAEDDKRVIKRGVYIFMKSGDKEKAKKLLDRLLKIAPDDPEVVRMTGMIAEDKGRIRDAIKSYESAIRIDPEDLTTIQSLGTVYMHEKMWKETIRLYRKSLAYHPNTPFLLEGLGKLLVSCPDPSLRNIKEGLEFSERAFIRSTSPVTVQISSGIDMANAYAGLGDFNKARYFINICAGLARRNNLPEEYLKYIESLQSRFSFAK